MPVSPVGSVAATMNSNSPAVVGVPASAPELLRVSPGGGDLTREVGLSEVSVKVNGPAAPDAVSAWPYAAPTWPAGSDDGVMVTTAPATWTSTAPMSTVP